MTSRNHILSQNFLRSPKLALMLIGHSNIKKKDLVVEVGAGSGVITSALSKRCREVWAIEPDHQTAEKLRANLKQRNIENVKVIEKDFREVEMPNGPYKVFSNPPFHLSAEVFYKFLNLKNEDGKIVESGLKNNEPKAIYLILQKQLALKLIPTERHYTSQLGRKLCEKYASKIRLPLKGTDFTPPPAVPIVFFEAKKLPSEAQENNK